MNDARAANGERKERMRICSHRMLISTHGERARERKRHHSDIILVVNKNSLLLDDQSERKALDLLRMNHPIHYY